MKLKLLDEETWRRPIRITLIVAALFAVVGPAVSPRTADAQEPNAFGRGDSPKNARRNGIIRQTGLSNCGPAALATLFTFYFDDPVTEAEMVRLVGARVGGVSTMRELRDACHARGYSANGVGASLPNLLRQIESSGVPVLVHFKEPTQHYVLLLGRVGDHLLVADPARGETTMHETDFLRRWDNVALIVKPARPVDASLIERRKRSAEKKLMTLQLAGSIMAATRF